MLDRKNRVKRVRNLGAGNYLLTLGAPEQASLARPGQFLMVKCCEGVDDPPLLRRPFSIFAIDRQALTGKPAGLEILVKDVGIGTHKLALIKTGQYLFTLGPQGKPFQITEETASTVRYACLVAGGVGIAALYLLAQELLARKVNPILFYGARTAAELVLRDYFERLGIEVRYSTEDGSLGVRGLVTAPLNQFLGSHGRRGARIYTCGPWAMMGAVHKLARRHRVPCEVSLEARMGCSLGACMGCVVKSGDAETPRFVRVCMEGPVMNSSLIDWDSPPL